MVVYLLVEVAMSNLNDIFNLFNAVTVVCYQWSCSGVVGSRDNKVL